MKLIQTSGSILVNREDIFNFLKSLAIVHFSHLRNSQKSEYSRGFDEGFQAALIAVAQAIGGR